MKSRFDKWFLEQYGRMPNPSKLIDIKAQIAGAEYKLNELKAEERLLQDDQP